VAGEQLDDWLGGLGREGRLDSHGQFTVDAAARQRKERQRFSEPALFLLKGVQAAVSLGSPEVHLTIRPDLVECICKPTLPLELAQLAGHLQDAISFALSLAPIALSLSFGRQHWSWEGGQALRSEIENSAQLRLALKPAPDGFFTRWLHIYSYLRKIQTIQERCALCPIPIAVNGRLLNMALCPEKVETLRCCPSTRLIIKKSYFWMGERLRLTSGEQRFCLVAPLLRSAARILVEGQADPLEVSFDKGRCSVVTSLSGGFSAKAFDFLGREGGTTPLLAEEFAGAILLDTYSAGVPLTQSLDPALVEQAKFSSDRSGLQLEREARVVGAALLRGMQPFLQWSLARAGPIEQDSLGQHRPEQTELPSLRVERWLGLRADPQGRSLLCYVQDGVLLDPVPVDTHFPGTVAILARSSVPTDFSLLRPREGPDFTDDLVWMKQEEQRLGQSCRPVVQSSELLKRYGVPLSVSASWKNLC
jgi:hypothetical protein